MCQNSIQTFQNRPQIIRIISLTNAGAASLVTGCLIFLSPSTFILIIIITLWKLWPNTRSVPPAFGDDRKGLQCWCEWIGQGKLIQFQSFFFFFWVWPWKLWCGDWMARIHNSRAVVSAPYDLETGLNVSGRQRVPLALSAKDCTGYCLLSKGRVWPSTARPDLMKPRPELTCAHFVRSGPGAHLLLSSSFHCSVDDLSHSNLNF